MGGGFYSVTNSCLRAEAYAKSYASDATYMDTQVFKERSLNESMDIKGKVRESRDSTEHPTSYPIIIGLDVTGSMGTIPKNLIQNGLPKMMEKIMNEGIEHAQLCFMGLGDEECDSAPLQVGQFETSDELCEKWLTSIYLEGGGGGNNGESYSLAWLAASRNMSTDAFEKRGIKGILITIGDEENLKVMHQNHLKEFFGDVQADITDTDLLEEVREKWNVFHINVSDWSGSRKQVRDYWKQLLGDNYVETQSHNGDDIPNLIAGIVIKCYKESQKSLLNESGETTTDTTKKTKTADELLEEIENATKN